MAAKTLFYYFGDDEAYFKALSGEFAKQIRLPIEFKRIFESDEKKIQTLFLKVFLERPSCVFIDFSKCTQDYLHLARIIGRTPFEHEFVTVGLVDYLSPPEVLIESIATGANLTHIKSAETFDVIFDVAKLVAPKEMDSHGFAVATLKEELEAGVPVKIGYVENEGLHFETDYKLQKGDRIKLKHHWQGKRVVPSRECFIKNVSQKNLFYQYKFAVDLDFMFVDEFLPPEGMSEKEINERKSERNEDIHYHKKQLKKWINDNATRSLEKKAKVLVIDREFNFYKDQQRTDKHPYTIRCVPYILNIDAELDRLEPQVIAFSLELDSATEPKNTMTRLREFVHKLKSRIQDSSPVVVVFNSQLNSKEIQDDLRYPQIMATDSEFSVPLLLKMADIYDSKLAASGPKVQKKEEKVFLSKNNPASIAEICIPITVIKLSESNMIFQCEYELPIGMNLHLTKPVNMYINVQPSKNQGKVPEYQGLIHSMGEDNKKELRRFVNSVFFRDHDAQVTAETDEFKKLNEAKLLEKTAEAKKEETQESSQSSDNSKNIDSSQS